MNILIRWLVAVLIVVTVVASLGFVKYTQVQAAIAFGESFPEPSASVNTVVTEVSQHEEQIRVTGQIVAPQTLMVSTELPGKVAKVGFNPGDKVTAGQLLIEQDVSQEKAQLEGAKARVDLAKKTLSRYENLYSQKRISQDQVDQARTDLRIATADVNNLTASINKKTINAPFAGSVGLEQFQVGQLLSAGENITHLVGINDYIWLDFQLPQTQQQLTLGDSVLVKVIGGSANSVAVKAEVIARNAALSANSRHVKYRAKLDNTQGLFSHNQVVTVSVPQRLASAVLVPNSAVTRNQHGEYVYLLEKDENDQYRAKPIKVSLGKRKGDNQLITSGLVGGEFIATQGAFKLREGLLVYPKQAEVMGGL